MRMGRRYLRLFDQIDFDYLHESRGSGFVRGKTNNTRTKDRVAAAGQLLDRGHGRPHQMLC
jgi:hypothetical protein